MRITNGMMLNTSKSNINNNKVTLDKYQTQLATQKKIQKPSEDPIVALRSLRLRKSVAELEQYYSKNIVDAESWLEVTESSIKNMSEVLQDMYYDFTKGANGEWSTQERLAIVENLESLCSEFYKEGNASYAGRTIFTGYKTDTNFIFLEGQPTASFEIKETFKMEDIKTNSYVSQQVTINSANPSAVSANDAPKINEIFSFSLAYTGVASSDFQTNSLEYYTKDASGNNVAHSIPCRTVEKMTDLCTASGTPPVYEYVGPGDNEAVYVADTGEIIFGKNVANDLKDAGKNTDLSVTYKKTGFNTNDINPVFYFDCTDVSDADPAKHIEYKKEDQAMEYQVGPNQYIKVNTQADELMDLNIMKDIRRLRASITDVESAEAKVTQLKEMLESTLYTDDEKVEIQSMLEAANKECDLKKSIAQALFEHGIDDFKAYQDHVEVQKTDLGNRDARLAMIKERTSQQLTTFNELLTNNEDINLSDIILNSTAASYAYQLSLQAVGSISQLSLLNYL